MSRSFVKYPANHHLSQIVERATVSGAFALVEWPFVEVSLHEPRAKLSPSEFHSEEFHGSGRTWTFSIGARVKPGTMHHRMGRHGAAIPRERHARVDDMEQM